LDMMDTQIHTIGLEKKYLETEKEKMDIYDLFFPKK
jgi:hypothetical protein